MPNSGSQTKNLEQFLIKFIVLFLSINYVNCNQRDFSTNFKSSLNYDFKNLEENSKNRSYSINSKLNKRSLSLNDNWSSIGSNQRDDSDQFNESEQLDQLTEQLEQINEENVNQLETQTDQTEQINQAEQGQMIYLNKQDQIDNKLNQEQYEQAFQENQAQSDEPKQIKNVLKIPIGK